jgi:hypothetical protein
MRRQYIKVIVFLILTFAMFLVLEKCFDKRFSEKPLVNKTSWILTQKNGSYDYAVLGASDVMRGIDPARIDSATLKKGINLATEGTCLAENLMLLQKFIENGNSVKQVYLQVYTQQYDTSENFKFNFHFFIPLLNDKTIAGAVKEQLSPVKYYTWQLIPFSKYAEFNSIYTPEEYLKKSDPAYFSELDANKGADLLKTAHRDNFGALDKPIKLRYAPDNYLNRVADYCAGKKITLTLISMPRHHKLISYYTNRDEMYSFFKTFAKDKNIRYLNFTSAAINADTTLFYDYSHLNKTGAISFSKQFADSIKLYN